MLVGYRPVVQALLGTLFTWGVTALGSALVFVFSSGQVSEQVCHVLCFSVVSSIGPIEDSVCILGKWSVVKVMFAFVL